MTKWFYMKIIYNFFYICSLFVDFLQFLSQNYLKYRFNIKDILKYPIHTTKETYLSFSSLPYTSNCSVCRVNLVIILSICHFHPKCIFNRKKQKENGEIKKNIALSSHGTHIPRVKSHLQYVYQIVVINIVIKIGLFASARVGYT